MDIDDRPKIKIENETIKNATREITSNFSKSIVRNGEKFESSFLYGFTTTIKLTDKFGNYFELEYLIKHLGVKRAIVKFNKNDYISMSGICIIENYVRTCEEAFAEFMEKYPEHFIKEKQI